MESKIELKNLANKRVQCSAEVYLIDQDCSTGLRNIFIEGVENVVFETLFINSGKWSIGLKKGDYINFTAYLFQSNNNYIKNMPTFFKLLRPTKVEKVSSKGQNE